jgi:hypothetical protein
LATACKRCSGRPTRSTSCGTSHRRRRHGSHSRSCTPCGSTCGLRGAASPTAPSFRCAQPLVWCSACHSGSPRTMTSWPMARLRPRRSSRGARRPASGARRVRRRGCGAYVTSSWRHGPPGSGQPSTSSTPSCSQEVVLPGSSSAGAPWASRSSTTRVLCIRT